jgi:hypothetical protein
VTLICTGCRRLELQCLLQQLEELSQGVEALLLNQTEQPACNTQAVLAEAGHTAPAAAYRSLSQHVAAAGAMQRLKLPSQHTQAAPAADADAEQSGGLRDLDISPPPHTHTHVGNGHTVQPAAAVSLRMVHSTAGVEHAFFCWQRLCQQQGSDAPGCTLLISQWCAASTVQQVVT